MLISRGKGSASLVYGATALIFIFLFIYFSGIISWAFPGLIGVGSDCYLKNDHVCSAEGRCVPVKEDVRFYAVPNSNNPTGTYYTLADGMDICYVSGYSDHSHGVMITGSGRVEGSVCIVDRDDLSPYQTRYEICDATVSFERSYQSPEVECYTENDCACITMQSVTCECISGQCVATPIDPNYQFQDNSWLIWPIIILILIIAGSLIYIRGK